MDSEKLYFRVLKSILKLALTPDIKLGFVEALARARMYSIKNIKEHAYSCAGKAVFILDQTRDEHIGGCIFCRMIEKIDLYNLLGHEDRVILEKIKGMVVNYRFA